jgi:ketosteroid isomerase-like protein
MRSYQVLAIITLLIPAVASAQYSIDFVPHTADEKELVRIENQWSDGAIHRDAKLLEGVFADDVRWVSESGDLTKAQIIKYYLTTEAVFHSIAVTNVTIRIIDRVAIITSHVTVDATKDGKRTKRTHTSVDVFEKRNGRWWCITT